MAWSAAVALSADLMTNGWNNYNMLLTNVQLPVASMLGKA